MSTAYARTAALEHSDKDEAAQVLKDTYQVVRVGDPPGVAGQHAGLFHVVVADGVGVREDGAVVQLQARRLKLHREPLRDSKSDAVRNPRFVYFDSVDAVLARHRVPGGQFRIRDLIWPRHVLLPCSTEKD